MASNNNPIARPGLPMSFSQSSIGSANTLNFSHSQMGSFNASQSVASTPRATPPPPKGSQQSNMSFGYPNGAGGVPAGGVPAGSRSGYGGFEEQNGYGAVMSVHDGFKPQIYRAVYSNVHVYEMEVNGIAVMKRRDDSWLNATQILKVAGVVKARRTKTLEKEIAAGEHEKVQGGYGKYQGTWVNFHRGVDLCREYHVEGLLKPLLEYDPGANGVGGGSTHDNMDTPTKEQAMAAHRKRLYNGMEGNRSASQPQQGTFFQNISRTAATAVNAISKARFDSPAAKGGPGRRPSGMQRSVSGQEPPGGQVPFSSQQSMYSMTSDNGFANGMQNGNRLPPPDSSAMDQDEPAEPPRKRIRSTEPSFGGLHREPSTMSMSMHEPAPTEPNDSFYQDLDVPASMVEGLPRGSDPLPAASTPERFQKTKLIMTLFLDKRTKDFSTHPALLQLSGEDLEIPLDEYQNNALHWAAMLARMPLVHSLIQKGVSIFRVNGAGETALQKSVGTRNNLDYRSFPRLLQVLAPTIDMVDYSGRTILHHIAVMAATGGGGHVSAKHYMEALLEFIVRHGGTSVSMQTPSSSTEPAENAQSGGVNGGGPIMGEVITLGRFISEIVNLRDDQGDTALNLAGRARSVLVPQLLEVGADPHIPNHTGLRPADYGVGVDMVDGNSQQAGNKGDSFTDQLAKTKKEILDATISQVNTMVQEALNGLDRELASSLTEKQEKFDHWHAKIRETAKARQIEQKQLDELKRKGSDRVELDRRIRNLERSLGDISAVVGSMHGESKMMSVGDADKDSGVDVDEFEFIFPESFDPTAGLSEKQVAYLSSLPSPDTLRRRLGCYQEFNDELLAEVDLLKSKNVILGQNYRRMVMACTEWTADQVDEAADGLTQCVKELNDNPVPEDEAIEILMRDRGQDW